MSFSILLLVLAEQLGETSFDDEIALIERARQLDDDAWQIIYNRYYNRLYSFFYFRFGDTELAEELTAQVFERAVKHICHFRHQGSTLGAWLHRIAHNLANDQLRRHKSGPPAPPLELIEEGIKSEDDPWIHVLQDEATRLLRQALDRLTPEQREIVLLRFVAQMTAPEIATITGKTTGAIKALQHRALASLRRELEALGYHGLS